MCSSFPVRTPKLQPTAGQPLIGECQIPTKKDTLCPRAKEKPPARWHVGQIVFRIKPHTHHRRSQGSNKNLCAPGDPTENEPDLPLSVWVSPEEVWVSSGLPQGQGLWVQQPWVWHKPSWRRLPWNPRELPELTQDWGSRPLEAQTEPCAQDPGERSSDPTGGWPRLAQSVQESPAEAQVSGGLRQGGGCWAWPCMRGTFWRRSPFSSLPPPQLGQTTGREHSHAHQQKIGLKIYWAWLHPSEPGPVSPSVSLSH